MTSRYLTDLLATTMVGHYEAPAIAELLEDAEDPAAVFIEHFDQFSTDIERRFLQTIGIHKAIAAVSEALPNYDSGDVVCMRADAAGFLRRCVRDYECMTETFFACDLRGLPLERGIRKIIKCLGETRADHVRVADHIEKLPLSDDPAIIILKTAALPLLRLAIHDYALLIELFEQIRPRANEWRQ